MRKKDEDHDCKDPLVVTSQTLRSKLTVRRCAESVPILPFCSFPFGRFGNAIATVLAVSLVVYLSQPSQAEVVAFPQLTIGLHGSIGHDVPLGQPQQRKEHYPFWRRQDSNESERRQLWCCDHRGAPPAWTKDSIQARSTGHKY